MFHFLTNAADRAAYVRQMMRTLRPGGYVVVGAFATTGPMKCSGQDVVRYDAAGLEREFGPRFRLVQTVAENHVTPLGKIDYRKLAASTAAFGMLFCGRSSREAP